MRKLIFLALALVSIPAAAMEHTATIDAVDDLVAVYTVKRSSNEKQMASGFLNMYGTINGCTIHWLVSTDDGTTKTAYRDLTGTAATSTAADNFDFTLGLPSGNSGGAILYASAAGCSGAPSLTVDIDDYR